MNLKELLKSKIKQNKGQTIILDTSALESKMVMEVIQKATKVILLTGILDEMDKHKTECNLFGSNIREVSRKSREDVKSEKYICVAGYERYDYNDKNIIDYCRKHRKTVIVTCDNNLCNYAKAYQIKYIFFEKQKKEETQVSNVKKDKKKKKQKIVRQKVKGVSYEDGNLYLNTNRNPKNCFLFREEKIVNNALEGKIELKLNDLIYLINLNQEGLTLTEYEIQVISEHNYAFCKTKQLIQSCESYDVKEKKFPEEVTKRVLDLLNLKPKAEKDDSKQNKEVQFYRKWIEVTRIEGHQTTLKLEREGNLIRVEDYQEGDYLYILRYNINKRYIEITKCKIIFEDNEYDVDYIDKQRVYYINEIYKMDFSENLKDEIWKLLIKNSEY